MTRRWRSVSGMTKSKHSRRMVPIRRSQKLLGARKSTLLDKLVQFHFSPERGSANLQRVGRLTPIAPKPLERARDDGSFVGLQIESALWLVITLLEERERQLSGL